LTKKEIPYFLSGGEVAVKLLGRGRKKRRGESFEPSGERNERDEV